jgi:hypothetical protein
MPIIVSGDTAQSGGQPEGAADPRCAFHPGIAAHQLGQTAGDGQPQAGAAKAPCDGIIGLLKSPEQAWQMFGGDADTGTLDTAFGVDNVLASSIYNPGSVPVVLDSNVLIRDNQLDLAANYNSSSLVLARYGFANSQDIFDFNTGGASFTVSGGNLLSAGNIFATWSLTGGTLTINFTGSATAATRALVQDVMQRIRYSNTSNNPGYSAHIGWTFNDGNTGAQGDGGNGTATGSTVVNIVTTNNAPVVKTIELNLANIVENSGSGAGNTVANIIPASAITDSGAAVVRAAAIVGSNNTNGTWQYSINNGSTWIDIGARSNSNALLLDGTLSGTLTNKLRFVPNANYSGTAALTWRAWDKTAGSGVAGDSRDVSNNGGRTPFSSNTGLIQQGVTAVNYPSPTYLHHPPNHHRW